MTFKGLMTLPPADTVLSRLLLSLFDLLVCLYATAVMPNMAMSVDPTKKERKKEKTLMFTESNPQESACHLHIAHSGQHRFAMDWI